MGCHDALFIMQDGEIRKAFERSLKKQGFSFMLNTKVWPLLLQPFATPLGFMIFLPKPSQVTYVTPWVCNLTMALLVQGQGTLVLLLQKPKV